jgi:hypothetical protein
MSINPQSIATTQVSSEHRRWKKDPGACRWAESETTRRFTCSSENRGGLVSANNVEDSGEHITSHRILTSHHCSCRRNDYTAHFMKQGKILNTEMQKEEPKMGHITNRT